jgi:uncharacterized protein (UPF0332 family)
LRDALSRSYYSIFHIGLVLLRRNWIRHENLSRELERIDPQLARTVGELSKLRERADYEPDFVTREFNGDLDLFRAKTADWLEQGRSAYERLLEEIEKA